MNRRRPPRAYDSTLRREQAEETAARILDAVRARIGKGDREISYAAVAREARISVPTVYRHFPTHDDLLRAFTEREAKAHGEVPVDRASLSAALARLFGRFDDPSDPFHTIPKLSASWKFSRVGSVPRRRAWFDAYLAEEAPHLPEPERTWLIDVFVVLVSSTTGEAFAGYLDLKGAEMVPRVELALDALLGWARDRSKLAERSAGGRDAKKKRKTKREGTR